MDHAFLQVPLITNTLIFVGRPIPLAFPSAGAISLQTSTRLAMRFLSPRLLFSVNGLAEAELPPPLRAQSRLLFSKVEFERELNLALIV